MDNVHWNVGVLPETDQSVRMRIANSATFCARIL
jgi:hypothetical protein